VKKFRFLFLTSVEVSTAEAESFELADVVDVNGLGQRDFLKAV